MRHVQLEAECLDCDKPLADRQSLPRIGPASVLTHLSVASDQAAELVREPAYKPWLKTAIT